MPPSSPITVHPRADFDVADAAYAALFAVIAVWWWDGMGLAEAARFHTAWLVTLAAPASVAAAWAAWHSVQPVHVIGDRRAPSPPFSRWRGSRRGWPRVLVSFSSMAATARSI